MSKCNRHGLSRNIPEDIKRQARKECGFGCIICGSSLIEYEHIAPEFTDAKKHDPAGIALLCPQCHSKKTRGFMPSEDVFRARQKPHCKINGASREKNLFSIRHQAIRIGGATLRNCEIPILCAGIPLIQFTRDPGSGELLFSGIFFSPDGYPSLVIKENEWLPLLSNWDVEIAGGVLTIRSGPGNLSLRLHVDHEQGIIVDRLDAFVFGRRVVATDEDLKLLDSAGNLMLTMTKCIADNCKVGISF